MGASRVSTAQALLLGFSLDSICRLLRSRWADMEVTPEELTAALEEFGQRDGTTFLVVEASEEEAEQLATAGLTFRH